MTDIKIELKAVPSLLHSQTAPVVSLQLNYKFSMEKIMNWQQKSGPVKISCCDICNSYPPPSTIFCHHYFQIVIFPLNNRRFLRLSKTNIIIQKQRWQNTVKDGSYLRLNKETITVRKQCGEKIVELGSWDLHLLQRLISAGALFFVTHSIFKLKNTLKKSN